MKFADLPTTQFLLVTQGWPGSGKSTWALDIVHQASMMRPKRKIARVNRDAIRLMLHGERFDPQYEKAVSVVRDESIRALLGAGYSVINDDTNLSTDRLNELEFLADGYATFVVNSEFLNVSLDKCIENDLKRPASVGRDVIERMYADYWHKQPKPPHDGHPCIVVDLDGTLAHTNLPFPQAYDRDYREDDIDQAVFEHIRAMSVSVDIIIVTGREGTEKRMQETYEWLDKYHVPYTEMYMRAAGDRRDDAIVKKEIYMEHLLGTWQPAYVIDDRPRVVRMWRHELGLPVMQVGDGRIF